ncbi:MAG: Asp23/Gls24 family envelope stress response protein [Clostridia bacterium]|nr:Asp23/Gls24 family envelope stress response protein [Clostridia bacterium]
MEENKVTDNNIEIQESGTVKISEEVVSTIASLAATGIEGVSSMNGTIAGGLVELLGVKKNNTKGIKVDIDGNNVTLDIHISVIFGYKIPEVAWEIQEKVKAKVEEITGLNVEKVNIHVDAIAMDKSKKEAISDEEIPSVDAELINENGDKGDSQNEEV